MEFQKVIETRRTVRKYSADERVTREQMEELLRAAQELRHGKTLRPGAIIVFCQKIW